MTEDKLNHDALAREVDNVTEKVWPGLIKIGDVDPMPSEAAPTMTQQVMREEYAAQRLEHAVQLRVQAELKKYTNRSDSTLILLLTEKDAEIAELTRQLNESRDALGKEKAALNQTLKKVGPLENSLIGLRDSVRSMMEKQPSSLTGFERIREAMAVSEKVLPPLGLSTTL